MGIFVTRGSSVVLYDFDCTRMGLLVYSFLYLDLRITCMELTADSSFSSGVQGVFLRGAYELRLS